MITREVKQKAMEFLSPFNVFLTLSISLSFVFSLFNVLKHYGNTIQTKKSLPGPWKVPLMGNIHQLVGGLPHHTLRDLAGKYGPIMHLKLGEISLVVVSSSALAKEILKTRDPIFAGRPNTVAGRVMFYDSKDVITHTYDDYWIQMRRIFVHEMINAKNTRLLAAVRLAEGENMISLVRNSAGQLTNISERISQYTMSVVCKAAFGRLCQDKDKFVRLIDEFAVLAGGFDLGDMFPSYSIFGFLSGLMPKVLKVHRDIDTFLEAMIDEHIKAFHASKTENGENGEQDLVDILLKAKDGGGKLRFPLTNANIKALIANVFIGGIETSNTTALWAMSELARNPRVMAKVQAEIRQALQGKGSIDEASTHGLKYLNLVIKETLRFHLPAPLIGRECMEDCVVDGYTIPAKTTVMVNAWAIARDPAYWTNPESFIPERFEDNNIDFLGNNFENIPFGSGKRICPGIHFALANVELPLALLLYYFNWQLPVGVNPEDLDMSESFGGACGRKTDLCLIPTVHSPFVDVP